MTPSTSNCDCWLVFRLLIQLRAAGIAFATPPKAANKALSTAIFSGSNSSPLTALTVSFSNPYAAPVVACCAMSKAPLPMRPNCVNP